MGVKTFRATVRYRFNGEDMKTDYPVRAGSVWAASAKARAEFHENFSSDVVIVDISVREITV
jgi:hypothetical protein